MWSKRDVWDVLSTGTGRPKDPTVALCLGTYGDPREVGVFNGRGTPVPGSTHKVGFAGPNPGWKSDYFLNVVSDVYQERPTLITFLPDTRRSP